MASAEASSSRAVADAPHSSDNAILKPRPDELATLGTELSQYMAKSGATSLSELAKRSTSTRASKQRQTEAWMLEQAPAYLKLHDDIQSSQAMLSELSSFLHIFHKDLSALSGQMNALQSKSILLRQRLQNRRALEERLHGIVNSIVLSPQDIDLVFADETTAKGAGLDAWRGCAERLSACLFACQELESTLRDQAAGRDVAFHLPSNIDFKVLKEAREIADACRTAAAAKLRPLLISTFAPLRASLSTNLPVWQSILLRSYRPLYRFLSQHVPRVAIDVQRAYISAARLYFETGFRRYERALAKLRDKEKARGLDRTSFADLPAKSGFGPLFMNTASGTPATSQADPWMPDATQLDFSRLGEGPAVTLAYLADEPNYRAPLEALYRSLSLTFLDNSSSEFCFLARFFESIDTETKGQDGTRSGSATTPTDHSSAVKVRRSDAQASEGDEEEPLPEDSASARGDDTAAEEEEPEVGTVVRLSEAEKRRVRSRGAIVELWKQVMEPSLNTYTAFVKSILDLQPPLVSLYVMLRLNERLLDEVQTRGTASILQGPLMAFKLQAWPTFQRQFDDVVESVRHLRGSGSAGPGAAAAQKAAGSAGFLGGFGSMFGAAATAPTSAAGGQASDDTLRLVCMRYAYLFSTIVQLNSSGSSSSDGASATTSADESGSNIFASLGRLRTEVEALINAHRARTPASAQICYSALRNTLQTGPASVSQPHIQSELSHWTEAERSARGQ